MVSPIARTSARLFFLCCVAVWLKGCALYSETRHKQGEAAKAAWKDVDIAGQISLARKNEASVLAEELRTEEKLQLAKRDALIRAMVLGGTVNEKLHDPVLQQLSALAGDPEVAKAWFAAVRAERKVKENLATYELEFIRYGFDMPDCSHIKTNETRQSFDRWRANHPDDEVILRATWGRVETECAKPELNGTERFQFRTGALATTQSELVRAKQELETKKAASETERSQVDALANEYADALKKLTVDPSDTNQAKIEATAKKLKDALEKLEKFHDATSVQFLSEQKVKLLDQTLATMAGNAQGDSTANHSAAAIVSLAKWLDKTNASLSEAQKAKLATLILLRNIEQAKADVATRDVETQNMEVRLLQNKMNWQLERLRNLNDAYLVLHSLSDATRAMSVSTAIQPVDSPKAVFGKSFDEKAKVWKGAASYLNAVGYLEAEVNKTNIQRNALDHERAIAYAEGNISQWNVLISSSISQLADFGDSGIKKDDILSLINTITLLWIGKGVQ
jgi:hypothetical protein